MKLRNDFIFKKLDNYKSDFFLGKSSLIYKGNFLKYLLIIVLILIFVKFS